jgi:hypothetical protein
MLDSQSGVRLELTRFGGQGTASNRAWLRSPESCGLRSAVRQWRAEKPNESIGVLIARVWQSPRATGREVDLPEPSRYMRELDSHGPVAIGCEVYAYHPTFLHPCVLVLNQNGLSFLYRSREQYQRPVSIDRKCAGQLTERFSGHILSVDQHGHGQPEPLASSYPPFRFDLRDRRTHGPESRVGSLNGAMVRAIYAGGNRVLFCL